jgi:hypothetical protein
LAVTFCGSTFADAEDIEADLLWFGSIQEETILELDSILPEESRFDELLRILARWGPSDVLTTA